MGNVIERSTYYRVAVLFLGSLFFFIFSGATNFFAADVVVVVIIVSFFDPIRF